MSVLSLVDDPQFLRLSPGDQQAALAGIDPDFGKLNPDDFGSAVTALQKRAISRPDLVAPPKVVGPGTSMQPVDMSGRPQTSGATGVSFLPGANTNVNVVPSGAATEAVADVARGIVKSAGQTISPGPKNAATINRATGLNVPAVNDPRLKTQGVSENVGAGLESIGEFLTGDEALKGLSLAQRLGIAKHVAELAEKSPRLARMIELGMSALRGGTVTVPQQIAHGASPGEALETGATATALGVGTGVTTEALDAAGGKVAKAARGIIKGKAAASPEGEAALRQAATSVGQTEAPSLRTSLEKQIDQFEADAKANYRMIDKAAGTDFKALNAKLENTNFQIRQLTETEEDIAKEARLEKSRSALIEKIQQAKQDAIENGVDPKIIDEADAQFMQKEALKEVQAKVFKNPNVVGGNAQFGTTERVNVDEAVKQLQRLADKSEYGGSRLGQAFGEDAARRILQDMYAAQRSGMKYMTQQVWAKRIASALGAGGLGYEATRLLAGGSR